MNLPLLRASKLVKRFGHNTVLDHVDFLVHPGRIVGLLGENGAGKSTLIKCLAGVHRLDGGTIELDGRPVSVTSPSVARSEYGIDCVFQGMNLVPSLSVAANIFLARERAFYRHGLISRRRMNEKAAEVVAHVLGDNSHILDRITSTADELSLQDQRLIALCRAVSGNARLIILDEITALFSHEQVDLLFRIIRRLKKMKTGFVFISHRMQEVFALCDEFTVMKEGKVVGTRPRDQIDVGTSITMMTGRKAGLDFPQMPKISPDAPAILDIRDLSCGTEFRNFSLSVRRGEIVALAGLRGQGQEAILKAVFGLLKPVSGRIKLDGIALETASTRTAIRRGISYVSDDKEAELMLDMPIRDNLTLPRLAEHSRAGFMNFSQEAGTISDIISSLAVKAKSVYQPVNQLSGGNRQKIALGRWNLRRTRVLLLNEPTQGIDIGVKLDFYNLIHDLSRKGVAILLILTEMPEILNLPHRVLVIGGGAIRCELSGKDLTEDNVLRASLM